MIRKSLLIMAAGSSRRFETCKLQALLTLKGTTAPVIVHTLRACLTHHFDDCVVVVSADKTPFFTRLLCPLFPSIRIAEGGACRAESVRRGVQALQPTEWVYIHDGARPVVPLTLFDRLINGLHDADAVIPVLPVTDTIKEIEHQTVKKTLPRHSLVHVQTPQLCRFASLQRAYAQLPVIDETYTDEAMLIEAVGGSVRVINGDTALRKLTHKSDLSVYT